jgi:ketosteroid isomerase-like protein
MDGFISALNALDTERIAGFLAPDITVFVPTVQPGRVSGKAKVVEIFRGYVDTTKKTVARTSIVPEDLLIELGGDVAVVSFTVQNSGSMARRTFVFRRGGEAWLISHFHASNLRAPAQ